MITLPGGKYLLPIDHNQFLDETGTYVEDHPAMLYQNALFNYLCRFDFDQFIPRLKELIEYNRWHYDVVSNFTKIEAFNFDSSVKGFPSDFYFGARVMQSSTGEIKRWSQLVFKNNEHFTQYLQNIESILINQINYCKANTRKIDVTLRSKKRISGAEKPLRKEMEDIKCLFISEDVYQKQIQIMKLTNPPLLNDQNKSVLGSREKSAWTAWIIFLQENRLLSIIPTRAEWQQIIQREFDIKVSITTLKTMGSSSFVEIKRQLSNLIRR